jgi:ABC-2 type transport system ATP-binding protein
VLQGGEAMIEVKECSKAFGTVKAVNKATLDVGVREVFGLVGSNGAGKSTLLRMMAGIIRPDEGEIQIDGMPVYENEEAKKLFFYISDDSYFPANYTAMDLVRFYRNFYPQFRTRFFHELMEQFHLEENRRIATFSKGMKKQVLVIIGVCAATKYLFCDETFDGLDPVMRQAVKSLFASEIMNREFTPVIASHNLRELEDICDHVGLLHKGGILLSKDLEDMKLNIHKLQCVLVPGMNVADLKTLDIIHADARGSLCTLTVRGTREEIEARMEQYHPIFAEIIPLSLEEIFISETEVAGYDIKKLIL